jgi:hypothetical protein
VNVKVLHYSFQGVTGFRLELFWAFLTDQRSPFRERFRPFLTFFKIRNGHETLRNGQERPGTLDGLKRLQNHVHDLKTKESRHLKH